MFVQARSLLLAPIALLVLSSVVGCGGGDGLPREAVSGSVTLDGKPLTKGTVTLMPTDPTGPSTAVEATIATGSFRLAPADGPLPGAYRVMISSPKPAPPSARPGGRSFDSTSGTGAPEAATEVPLRETIPARYNAQSTLKADVKKGGPNVFEYPLTSK